MLAALDAHYHDTSGRAACVLFDDWRASAARDILTAECSPVAPYDPGAFYKRELPLLLAVLGKVREPLEAIVIDGYVWLGAGKPGLGAHLHREISTRIIGVAKTEFRGRDGAIPVLRGKSAKPLYVTAAGMDANDAAENIRAMNGAHRIPTLLSRADAAARGA